MAHDGCVPDDAWAPFADRFVLGTTPAYVEKQSSGKVSTRAQVLEAAEGFLLVISYNPGYQNVLKSLKPSAPPAAPDGTAGASGPPSAPPPPWRRWRRARGGPRGRAAAAPASHGPSLTVTDLAGLTVSAGGRPVMWHRDPYEPHAFHLDIAPGTRAIDVRFQMVAAADLLTPDVVSVRGSPAPITGRTPMTSK